MKVHQLIQILDELDSDGDVFITVNANYPFEHYVAGVTLREEMVECDGEQEAVKDRWAASPAALPRNEVLIVAGEQARYGSSDAWEVMRRA